MPGGTNVPLKMLQAPLPHEHDFSWNEQRRLIQPTKLADHIFHDQLELSNLSKELIEY